MKSLVPPPGLDSTANVPPAFPARERMFISPFPAAAVVGRKPFPLSLTSSVTYLLPVTSRI